MRERYEAPNQYSWIVYAVAVMVVGGMAGYILSLQGAQSRSSLNVAAAATAGVATPIVDESELRAYRDILARDPKNAQAALKAGNLLYDAQRYVEAIGFYQQAFALMPNDVNLSTDLGTALWYVGRADEALAQYEKSLAINATHAQTLFNVGIVRSDGKHDYRGAAAAWDTLLKTNPRYPDIQKVQSLLADARAKL
ncbi:MAG: tetratricopeptide repeat protein [Acidobacteriia bacterium]|nr:tetratricopeptide repeat protein [Terriglobia bacterium]